MRILSFLALVFIIGVAHASTCTSTSWSKTLLPTYPVFKIDNIGGYAVTLNYEASTTDNVDISIAVCNSPETANVAFSLDNHKDGYVSLAIQTIIATTTTAPLPTVPATNQPDVTGKTISPNAAVRINPLSSIFVLLIPMFFVNRRLSIIFAVLAVMFSMQVSHAESATPQITITVKLPTSIKQACNGDFCKHFQQGAQYVHGSRKYIALDGSSPYSTTTNACQTGNYNMPAGFSLATTADLEDLASTGAWSTTQCLVGETSVARSGDCSVSVTTKVVEGVDTFYSVDKCSRVILAADFVASKLLNFEIGMKVLVLSVDKYWTDFNPTDGGLALANTMLRALGVPYDLINLRDTTQQSSPLMYEHDLPLYDEQGVPKYYGIITTVDAVYSTLSEAQKTQLTTYKKLYSVREVKLFTTGNGIIGLNSENAGASVPAGYTLRVDGGFATDSANDYMTAGLNTADAKFDLAATWYNKVKVNTNMPQAKAVAKLYDASSTDTGYALGVIHTDQFETMQFFVGSSLSLTHSPYIANIWINWVTKGVWVGSRRVFLSPQIDDLFLSTGEYDPATKKGDDNKLARMSADDLEKTKAHLGLLNLKAPTHSNITLEFGFNNKEAEGNAKGDKTLMKKVQDLYSDFFWESHTWSHLDLTYPESIKENGPTSEKDADDECRLNIEYVRDTLFASKGGLDTPTYSADCMITPKISGLFNPNALRAIKKNGITCVVGDNSVANLTQPNPYLGEWTSEDKHGVNGIFIIPRFATEIYYDCSKESTQVAQFNDRYGPGGSIADGPQLTLDGIMKREAAVTVKWLGQFRHDPYMFHQGNLVRFSYSHSQLGTPNNDGKWNLIMLWLDSVVSMFKEQYTFPIITTAQKYLRDDYLARRERDSAGIVATMVVANGAKSSVIVSSASKCEVGVTGITAQCGGDVKCRRETYKDDVTRWQKLGGSWESVSLPSSGQWN